MSWGAAGSVNDVICRSGSSAIDVQLRGVGRPADHDVALERRQVSRGPRQAHALGVAGHRELQLRHGRDDLRRGGHGCGRGGSTRRRWRIGGGCRGHGRIGRWDRAGAVGRPRRPRRWTQAPGCWLGPRSPSSRHRSTRPGPATAVVGGTGSRIRRPSSTSTSWFGPTLVRPMVTLPFGPVRISPPGGIWSPACSGRVEPSGMRTTAPEAASSSTRGVDPRISRKAARQAAAAAASEPTRICRRRRRARAGRGASRRGLHDELAVEPALPLLDPAGVRQWRRIRAQPFELLGQLRPPHDGTSVGRAELVHRRAGGRRGPGAARPPAWPC